jgi:hypothetical protein
MAISTRRTRSSLLSRVGKLEERFPTPKPEEMRPVHPEWVAFAVAFSASTKHLARWDPSGELRTIDVGYEKQREAFLAFWAEPALDWRGSMRPATMKRELAERAATLAVGYVEEAATTAHKAAHGRDTGDGSDGLDFDLCCRLDGQTALREALTEAMVGELSTPKQPHPDERIRELATIFVGIHGQDLSLDGLRLPSNPRASRSDA